MCHLWRTEILIDIHCFHSSLEMILFSETWQKVLLPPCGIEYRITHEKMPPCSEVT